MEGECPEGRPSATESPPLPLQPDPPSVDYDVTVVESPDPPSVDYDVTVVENPDPPSVDYDVTVVENPDPPSVDYDVTVVESPDPPSVDYDVTVVPTSDPPSVDYDVTAVPTSDPPTADNDVPKVKSVDPPTFDNEVTIMESGTAPPMRQQSTGGPPHVGIAQRAEGQPPTKLCGYLHKLGGPLKSWKCRWFTYEETKCQLFYYRTAHDVNPLGRVELTDATFGYPLQADEGTFHIQTPERTFVLKAVNREATMYWLQQLQLKRWQHRDATGQPCADAHREGTADGMAYCTVQGWAGASLAASDQSSVTGGWVQVSQGSSGHCRMSAPYLLTRDLQVTSCYDFLPMVKAPTGLVGEEAARQPAPRQHATLSNVSFKHPLTEIQNSVHSLRLSRTSQDLSRSVFYWELEAPPSDPESPAQERQNINATEEGGSSPCLQTRKKWSAVSAPLPGAADRTSRLQQEVLTLAEEVKAQKELVRQLQQALGEVEREKGGRSGQAAQLQAQLETQRGQQGALQRSLEQRDAQVAELQGQVRTMMEKNEAKQQVVLRLSQQLAACLDEPHRAGSSSLGDDTFRQLQEETHNLKDDIEAYKIQNKFLNSEIYQLTRLWRRSSQQENSLMKKCAYLEARSCQRESRYLGVLRDLQESTRLDDSQQEALKRLIEDSVHRDRKDFLKLDPVREYDEYGFKIAPDFDVEDVRLLAKIQPLEIRSHNLLGGGGAQDVDAALSVRWAQYLSSRPSGEPAASPELKALLRAGVPREHRRRVWGWLVRARTRSLRDRRPRRYREMCEKSQASPHPACRQIQLDLHRTLTANQRFSSPSSPAVQQLHRVLQAFSWQNPTIGYCQGLNRLAALALLVLQDEEEAFWFLVAVVETIMPQDYYSKTLTASQADQRVLKDFMGEKLPRLAAHLEELQVDVSLVTFNWFLVVFIESLSSNILLRVWDTFLYEGTKVLFRYALALFKYREEDMLKIRDKVEIYQYLRFFTKTITDGRKLMNIAFSDMNPFPMRLLIGRRALHLERLGAELSELERLQREYAAESAERADNDLDAENEDDA